MCHYKKPAKRCINILASKRKSPFFLGSNEALVDSFHALFSKKCRQEEVVVAVHSTSGQTPMAVVPEETEKETEKEEVPRCFVEVLLGIHVELVAAQSFYCLLLV